MRVCELEATQGTFFTLPNGNQAWRCASKALPKKSKFSCPQSQDKCKHPLKIKFIWFAIKGTSLFRCCKIPDESHRDFSVRKLTPFQLTSTDFCARKEIIGTLGDVVVHR
jgi:hypothetical protein